MEWLIALLALTAMEIVLGIDNIVFITIVSNRLPLDEQPLARRLGLLLALATRLMLLFVLSYIVHNLTEPIFNLVSLGIPESWVASMGVPKELLEYGGEQVAHIRDDYFIEANGVSWKDIILFVGGLFLVGKSVHEIHDEFGHGSGRLSAREVREKDEALAKLIEERDAKIADTEQRLSIEQETQRRISEEVATAENGSIEKANLKESSWREMDESQLQQARQDLSELEQTIVKLEAKRERYAKKKQQLQAERDELKDIPAGKTSFASALVQIALLDVVFSLDSVITAVGMVDELWVMVVAIVIAVVIMLVFAETVSKFVSAHPTLKMLALSFLILIGVMLVAEGVGAHVDKGYIYFAMFFAVIVEVMNLRLRKKTESQLPQPV